MNRTKHYRGTVGFHLMRVCIGRMMILLLMLIMHVEGANVEAWQKIYDHWDLGASWDYLGCRSDPCGCPVFCTDNVITKLVFNPRQFPFTNASIPQLTGSIPAELGELKALTYLDLRGNQLTGSIPAELGKLKALTSLYLSGNQLRYPAPASVIALCTRFGPSNCVGLIPPNCTAYKRSVSSVDLQSCTDCPYSTWETLILFIVVGLVMFFAARKLLQLIKDYPGSVGGTVSSISIITSHAQMMSVVSRMDLSWPGEVKKAESVLHALYLNLPEVVRLQCLFPGEYTIVFWFILFVIFVLLLFVPSCIKCCGCCKESRNEIVDNMYNSLGLMMSLLAITFTKAAMALSSSSIVDIDHRSGTSSIIIPLIISPVLFYIFFKYFREMRAMQGKWDGEMCRCCCPKCWDCSFLFCLKPITMSQERLKRRLNYLTKRFGDHAPYWQFIVWGRQISIILVNFSFRNDKSPYSKWILSAIVIIICSLALLMHVRVKPFIHDFQNEVDKWLLICNIVIVFIAVFYSEALKNYVENDPSNVRSWVFSGIILIAMFGSLVYAIIYLQLWKKMRKLLYKMWKHDDTAVNATNDKMGVMLLNNDGVEDVLIEDDYDE